MTNKKREIVEDTYYFVVEGDCEELYLLFLKNIINLNKSPDKGSIQFKIIRKKRFSAKIKNSGIAKNTTIYYVYDYENSKDFRCEIDTIVNFRKETKSKYTHILCYTNLSFELWMILHKNDMNKVLNNVKQYKKYVNKAFGKCYESISDFKVKSNFEDCLSQIGLPEIRQAIKREKNMMESRCETDNLSTYGEFKFYENNPSLNIGSVISEILEKFGIEV